MTRLGTSNLRWGVVFVSQLDHRPHLLWETWCGERVERWRAANFEKPDLGEPQRVLLFMTRAQARAWCTRKNALHKQRGWHFRPARVREKVTLA